MIKCPKCLADAEAMETRDVGKGPLTYVRRRRRCTQCGKRITTYEVIVDEGITGDVMVVGRKEMMDVLRVAVAAFSSRIDDDGVSAKLLEQLLGADVDP